MTDRTLAVDGWEETAFERGTYGPDDREGLAATLERDSMRLHVVPVRYECTEGREELRGLTRDLDLQKRDGAAFVTYVPRTTAFCTFVEYTPVSTPAQTVACIARDADDALAVAAWFARAVETDRELDRALKRHRGERVTATDVTVSDDDALAALFRAEPDACAYTGKPSRSHRVTLPYRYFPLLRNSKERRGVPRVPSTVRALEGAVSHAEWTDRDLETVEFDAPLTREAPGEYRLPSDAVAAVDGMDATNFSLRRLGQEI